MDNVKEKILSTGLFDDNEHLVMYIDIINSAKTAIEYDNTIYECHHIVPRCVSTFMGEEIDDGENNKVNLTIKNHLLAHYHLCLCAKETKIKAKLIFAVLCMLQTRKFPNYKELLETLDEYELLKKLASNQRKEYMVGNSYGKGIKLSEETKQKMSASRIGHETAEDTKQKISQAHKGKKWMHKGNDYKQVVKEDVPKFLSNGWVFGGKPISEEQKKQISNKNTGKKRSIEAKEKMSKAKLGKTTWNKGIPQSQETKEKNSATHKGRRWANNGINEIMIPKLSEVPEGYVLGRIKTKGW